MMDSICLVVLMMIYKNLNIYYHLKESMNTMSTQ